MSIFQVDLEFKTKKSNEHILLTNVVKVIGRYKQYHLSLIFR